MPILKIYQDSKGPGTCRSCAAPITWAELTSGKRMPFDGELVVVTVDDDLAPHQMRELAEIFEDITRRQAAFNAKADEAKTAKKSLESATEFLLERVRAFTHATALPLFDQADAQHDLDAMTGGAQDATA